MSRKSKKSLFGLGPDQLKCLFSLGTEYNESVDPENEEVKARRPNRTTAPSNSSGFTASLQSSVEKIGQWVGPYKLVRILGEGGMGIVYLAQQEEPIRRQVALKVLKPGMDSVRILARFETERQTLALLDHPNIAQVYQAGTTEVGRPYFAMQYIKGLPITEYCDHQILTIENRLELFLQVCQAVQHAHQKGIIHRDLKPSNILVSVGPDKAIPKIIDFGVAKAINQPLTERTLYTEQGQFIGTPEYMSPEQAGSSVEDIDTRSDVYSLGVVLYELLTGTLPFTREELGQANLADIQKIIRETDPPRPSTRLSSLGDEAKKVAKRRDTEAAALKRRLYKELEWIPLKAMRKEPDRRYQTVSELADDIRNYLAGSPLSAGPESRIYQFKKIMRRHLAAAIGMIVVLIILSLGIVISTIFAIEAHKQKLITETKELSSRRNLYFARIGLVQQAWEDGNIAYMLSLLDSLRPEPGQDDFRHFEWYYFWRLVNAHHRTLHAHSHFVSCVSFSPNGNILASASYDKTVKLWDPVNGQLKLTLPHTDQVRSLSFSTNGMLLATGCYDGTLRLWDVYTGQTTFAISGDNSISSVIFSPDGKTLASACFNGHVTLWNVVNSELRDHLSIEQEPFLQWDSLAFSPDGHTLAIGGGQYHQAGEVLLWDIESKRIRATLKGHTNQIRDIAFSPDGQHIATVNYDRTVRLWDAYSARELAVVEDHQATLFSVAFSPNGRYLATSSADSMIIIRDPNLNALFHLKGHTDNVKCITFSPDSKTLASASNDGTLKLWDLEAFARETGRLHHDAAVYDLAFTPDGNRLVTASQSGRIRLWDVSTEKHLGEFKGHTGPVWSVGISSDGKTVVTGSADRTVRLWDMESRHLIDTLPAFPDEIFSVVFSPDDTILAIACRDRSVILWDRVRQKKDVLIERQGNLAYLDLNPVATITFSPDGTLLSTGHHFTWNDQVTLWDVVEKKPFLQLHGFSSGNAAWSIPFSHNGRWVAATSVNKTITLWNKDTGQLQTTLHGHLGIVMSADFSPDDRILASGGMDQVVRIWDVQWGQQRAELKGHKDTITCVAFSPDGTILASASKDRSVILWRTAIPAEVVKE
jgi:WD40 repeat protein